MGNGLCAVASMGTLAFGTGTGFLSYKNRPDIEFGDHLSYGLLIVIAFICFSGYLCTGGAQGLANHGGGWPILLIGGTVCIGIAFLNAHGVRCRYPYQTPPVQNVPGEVEMDQLRNSQNPGKPQRGRPVESGMSPVVETDIPSGACPVGPL